MPGFQTHFMHATYKSLLRIFFVLLFVALWQQPDGFAQTYSFEKFGVAEGMMMSKVRGICEDDFGKLWIATSGSLTRFDGISFDNFTHRDGMLGNGCGDVIKDYQGNIWTSTYLGLSRYDGHSFQNYPMPYKQRAMRYDMPLFEDGKGTIWMGMINGGLARISEGKLTIDARWEGEGISTIGADAQGNVWIGTHKGSVFRNQAGNWEEVILPTGTSSPVRALFVDASQQMWIGTETELLRLSEQGYTLLSEVGGVYGIDSSPDGRLWLAATKGLFVYSEENFHPILQMPKTANLAFQKVFVDRESNVWYGVKGDGLYRFKGELFQRFDAEEGPNRRLTTTVAEDQQGRIWMGNWNSGIDVYDNGDLQHIRTVDGKPIAPIHCSAVDSLGQVWMGTKAGLLRCVINKAGKIQVRQYGFPSPGRPEESSIYSIACDQDGNLWLGGYKNLYTIPAQQLRRARPEISPIFDLTDTTSISRIRVISPLTNGQLALAASGGLFLYEQGVLRLEIPSSQVEFGDVSAIEEGRNSVLWLGTFRNGLFRYELDQKEIRHYTLTDGLTSEMIYGAVLGDENKLFVGSPNGLDRLVLEDDGEIATIHHFGNAQGFDGIEVNHGAIICSRKGTIWLGTPVGTFAYHPHINPVNPLPPRTHLTAIRLFYGTKTSEAFAQETSGWYQIPQSLRLPYDQNHLKFEFMGTSLRNPKGVRYQFILEGFETDWQPLTEQREAVYANLPPGDYTFNVKAVNSDGVWNPEPVSYSFQITPPFWQLMWFKALIIILLGVILYSIHTYRLQQHLNRERFGFQVASETQEEVRKHIARDFHDEMGNKLAGITAYANLIRFRANGTALELEPILTQITETSSDLFDQSRDFIWAIDPQSDDLEEIFVYLKDFCEEALNHTDIRFYAESKLPADMQVRLPLGHSRQIVLIFKEAFTNALKHSQATAIQLLLTYVGDEFSISLSDDGCGLEATEQRKNGRGLDNMLARSQEIDCLIEWNRLDPTGTCIRLSGIRPID